MTVTELITILVEIQIAHKKVSDVVICFSDDAVGDRIADIESVHLCDDDITVSVLCFEQEKKSLQSIVNELNEDIRENPDLIKGD